MTFVIGFLTAIIIVLICLYYVLFKQVMSLEKTVNNMADFIDWFPTFSKLKWSQMVYGFNLLIFYLEFLHLCL